MRDDCYMVAADMVLKALDHKQRIENVHAFIIKTFTVHKAGVRVLNKAMDDYIRNGNKYNLKAVIHDFSYSVERHHFGTLAALFLEDLLNNDYKSSVYVLHYAAYSKEKQVKQFLYDMATIVWPEKGLIGAIYG